MNKDENKNFLNNLFQFLDSNSDETLEELKEELREDGIDFDSAKVKLQETFSKLIKQKKNKIREQDRRQMLDPGI